MDLASDGSTGQVTARYGAWPSPIGASDVAVAGIRLSGPMPVHTDSGDEVWWAATYRHFHAKFPWRSPQLCLSRTQPPQP